MAALRRGPRLFMEVMRQNVAALSAQADLLAPAARADLAVIAQALARPPHRRLRALCLPGLHRQTWAETLLFRLWFLFG